MLGADSPEAVLDRGGVRQIITPETLVKLRTCLRGITVREDLVGYMVDIVRSTRTHSSVLAGAGPRATQALLLAARAQAAAAGRDFVTPDDIKSMAAPVLDHRIVLRPEFELEGLTVSEVIGRILQEIAVPR